MEHLGTLLILHRIRVIPEQSGVQAEVEARQQNIGGVLLLNEDNNEEVRENMEIDKLIEHSDSEDENDEKMKRMVRTLDESVIDDYEDKREDLINVNERVASDFQQYLKDLGSDHDFSRLTEFLSVDYNNPQSFLNFWENKH